MNGRLKNDIDGHDDLAILIRFLYTNTIYDPVFTDKFEKGGLELSVDLPRLKKGKVGGTFWSAFVPCPANGTDFSNEAYAQCKLILLRNCCSEETWDRIILTDLIQPFRQRSHRLISCVASLLRIPRSSHRLI